MNKPAPDALYNWRGKQLKQQEWDFRECPPSQLEKCLYHELMREWDWWRWKFPTPYAMPWLLKPIKERDEDCEATKEEAPLGVFGGRPTGNFGGKWKKALLGTHGTCPWTILADWKKWRKCNGGLLSCGTDFYCHFKIDLTYTNPQLVEAFAKWLDETFPRERKTRKITTTPDEWLKMLGVRRLLIAYGYARAKKEADRVGFNFYANERSWWKAKQKMEAFLRTDPLEQRTYFLTGV